MSRAAVMTGPSIYQRQVVTSTAQKLGPAVRHLRKQPLRAFCAERGLTPSTVSRFERGFDTELGHVLEILKALGCFVAGPDCQEIPL